MDTDIGKSEISSHYWNQPVERKTQALSDIQGDCFEAMWSWATCGGPRSRIRQLYVNGKLARCMDEYHIFKRCLLGKLNPQAGNVQVLEKHPLWELRTRNEAAEFWAGKYAHLGATLENVVDVPGGVDKLASDATRNHAAATEPAQQAIS